MYCTCLLTVSFVHVSVMSVSTVMSTDFDTTVVLVHVSTVKIISINFDIRNNCHISYLSDYIFELCTQYNT